MMIESGETKEENGWDKVSFLENAIKQHRLLLHKYELEETSIDVALWSALEGKWEFDSVNEDNVQ